MRYISKFARDAKVVRSRYTRSKAVKDCSKCGPQLAALFYPRGGTGLLQSRCKVCTKAAAVESKKKRATVGSSPFSRRIEL